MNKNLIFGLVAVVVVGTGIYLFYKQSTTDASTIKIGAAVGLSGSCASWGEGERKAYELAIKEANTAGGVGGKPLELAVEDTACESRGTVNATKKLIEVDNVVAILGPTWGDSFQAGYTVNDAAKVVSVSPSAAFESLFYNNLPFAYSFSTWFPEREDIAALQKYATEHNLKKVVLLNDQDPFGLMMVDLFEKMAVEQELQVIKKYKFSAGFDDFRTTITELKSLKPDAAFASFQGPLLKAKFLKQAHDLGLKVQLLSSTDIEDPSLLQEYSGVMEGIIYAYPEVIGAYDDFIAKYKAEYDTEPEGPSAANAYDAARVVIAGLTEASEKSTDLKTAIEQINISGTVVKNIQFSDQHQIGGIFQIKTVRNGQFVVVE